MGRRSAVGAGRLISLLRWALTGVLSILTGTGTVCERVGLEGAHRHALLPWLSGRLLPRCRHKAVCAFDAHTTVSLPVIASIITGLVRVI